MSGMDGYMLLTRSGSPLDRGAGPVRWAVLYRGKQAFVFGGASKSAMDGKPEADGLFKSTLSTMRDLKPADFPLAEPYRLKLIKSSPDLRLADYADDVPWSGTRKSSSS